MSPCRQQQDSSAKANNDVLISENDQLIKILQLVGSPSLTSNDDFFLHPEAQSLTYLRNLIDSNGGFENKLASKFKKTSEPLRDLLLQMLEFNSIKRPSASELLSHEVFTDIVDP